MRVRLHPRDAAPRPGKPSIAALSPAAAILCNATDDPLRERRLIERLLGKRVDGLIVTARRADKRAPIVPAAGGLPIVYVFSHVDEAST